MEKAKVFFEMSGLILWAVIAVRMTVIAWNHVKSLEPNLWTRILRLLIPKK